MKLIFMYNLDKEYWYHLCETLLLELRISWSVVFILLHVFSHLPHKAYPMLPRDNLLRWLSQLWFSLEKIIFLVWWFLTLLWPSQLHSYILQLLIGVEIMGVISLPFQALTAPSANRLRYSSWIALPHSILPLFLLGHSS